MKVGKFGCVQRVGGVSVSRCRQVVQVLFVSIVLASEVFEVRLMVESTSFLFVCLSKKPSDECGNLSLSVFLF